MKRTRLTCAAAGVAVLIFALGGRSASAEIFLDLYGGAAIFSNPDFTVTTNNGAERTTERGNADTQFTIGGRGGYWFDGQGLRWLGAALDISYFEPKYTRQGGSGTLLTVKMQTVPITPLVMFRLPLLESPDHPNGQLQLYTGIGPGFFVKDTTAEFAGGAGKVSKSATDVGVDFRAGLAYEFLPNWAAFTEYRFTHFSVSDDGRINGQRATIDADIDTNHVLFGISYRFR